MIYSRNRARAMFADSILSSINTMLICKVVGVDLEEQTVDVQPVVQAKVLDENSKISIVNRLGEEVFVSDVDMPVVQGVPICYFRAGTFMITVPVTVNDTGMLIVSQRDISNWKREGGVQPQSSLALFDINSSVFVPFVPNGDNKIDDYASDALEIRAGDDKISMKGDGTISITGDLVVSGEVTGNGIDLSTHKHSVSVPSTPYTGETGEPS